MRRLILCAAVSLIAGAALAQDPRKISSFNLCADQLVVGLADPQQIAALSPYAADPHLSVVAQEAQRFPRMDWQAESTVALAPDLVLVGPNDRTATRRMLASFGLRIVEVALVSDLAAARAQIRDVGALLGHPQRGEALVAKLDAAERRLAATAGLGRKTALVVERGGYAAGPQSLIAAMLATAGLTPPTGAPPGYGGFVSLERLLVLRPDFLIIKDPPETPNDQGALFFAHPAVATLYPPQRRIALPGRFAMCGGPALVAALDHLAQRFRGGTRRPADCR